MITKDEMLTIVRSVAVPTPVEEGMGHAFDLGAEWMREVCAKVCDDHPTWAGRMIGNQIRALEVTK